MIEKSELYQEFECAITVAKDLNDIEIIKDQLNILEDLTGPERESLKEYASEKEEILKGNFIKN